MTVLSPGSPKFQNQVSKGGMPDKHTKQKLAKGTVGSGFSILCRFRLERREHSLLVRKICFWVRVSIRCLQVYGNEVIVYKYLHKNQQNLSKKKKDRQIKQIDNNNIKNISKLQKVLSLTAIKLLKIAYNQYSLALNIMMMCIIQYYWVMSQTQQCENCLQNFPSDKLATHFGYCRRNIKRCPECNNFYDINNKEEHDEEFHKKSSCKFCSLEMAANDIGKHEGVCPKRTKYCEHCQLNVPVSEFERHLRACQARTKNCDVCAKLIKVGDFAAHLVQCREDKREHRDKKIPNNGKKQPINNQRNNYLFDAEKDQLTDFVEKKQMNFKKKQSQKYNIPARNEIKPIQPSTNVRTSSRDLNSRSKPQPAQPYKPSIGSKNMIPNQISSNSIPNSLTNQTKPSLPTKLETKLQKKTEQVSHGVKRPIVNPIKKQETSSSTRNSNGGIGNSGTNKYPTNVTGIKKQVKKSQDWRNGSRGNIDYRDFNDYYQYDEYNDDIPAQLLFPADNTQNPKPPNRVPAAHHHPNLKEFDEDEQIQKAILQSMQQQNKSIKNNRKQAYDNLPKDLQTQELMRASWSKDFDIEKQMAIYDDIQRKAKKNNKK